MSFRQRVAPLLVATLVGVAGGVYVFDPILKQYAIDSRGTFDPKIAQAGNKGGIGGGINDVKKISEAADKQQANSASSLGPQQDAAADAQEARRRLKEALDANRQGK